MDKNYFWQEFKETAFFSFTGLIMPLLIPILFGLVGGGFLESFVAGKPIEFGSVLSSLQIYVLFFIVGFFGILALQITKLVSVSQGKIDKSKHIANQKPSIWLIFSTPFIHDPEEKGLFYNVANYFNRKNWMKWSLSIARVLFISIIIFGFIGILQLTFLKFSFVGLPAEQVLPQQLTPLGKVFFSAEPPAFSETTFMLFIFCLLSGLNAYLCSRLKLGKWTWFVIELVILCPLTGFIWMLLHSIVYGNLITSQTTTFIFGWVGATLTVLFGSFIFWYIWHFMNNWFFKLLEIGTGNEDLIIITIVVWILITLIYISTEFLLYKYRKKREYDPPVPT